MSGRFQCRGMSYLRIENGMFGAQSRTATRTDLMRAHQNIAKLLERLWRHITPLRRIQLGLLLVLMIFASFAEMISIGAALPFLAVLTAPHRIFEHSAAQPLIRFLGVTDPSQLLLPITVIFVVAALAAAGIRLLLLWTTARLSFAMGADLSTEIYRRTLYQPYSVHVARNSGEIINGIAGKANDVIYTTIVPILTIVSAGIMLGFALVVFLSVSPAIALTAFGGFGLIYAVIVWIARKRLFSDSLQIAEESTNVIKSLQEGLGGIRDVLIDGSQAAYLEVYRKADHPLRVAQGNGLFVGQCPRSGVEALGMTVIAVLAYSFAQEPDGIAKAIPVLGAFVLGAQRLLPQLQFAYGSWVSIQSGRVSLQDALELLDQPLPRHADLPAVKALPFCQRLSLSGIAFRYGEHTPWVLGDININIEKGSRVGIIGTTGSGKSTLLDIVMGLLQPTAGTLEVDGQAVTLNNQRAWQAHIAHVPQAIFLADSTLEENIAFGVPAAKIDRERVKRVARQAQLADTIESWPKQYATSVGERGIRLSGGQRQRIGIARALYKQADVIIFDEATSALDSETEQAVMRSIESLGKDLTILIIAHRLTTLRNCTQIVELSEGRVKRIGRYSDIAVQPA